MAKNVLLEEFHLTLSTLPSLPADLRERLRRKLCSRSFRVALWKALRDVLNRFDELEPVRFRVSW